MDPAYVNVVEKQDMVWTLAAYAVHGAFVFVQVSLACFLIATGVRDVAPNRGGRWLRRLGSVAGILPGARAFAVARIGLGLLLFAPLAARAPMAVSLVGCVGAFVLLTWVERALPASERPMGRLVRSFSIAFAGAAALFIVWEGEDTVALAADVLRPAMEWRTEELRWQHENDPMSPKIGDLAPDFALQSSDGVTRVQLADFRGKQPVALVFGSYT
jgi:hypothetical protein